MKVSVPLAVSLVSSIMLSPAVLALDFGDMLKNYLGAALPTQAAANQDLVKTNMNTRQAQLESEIAAGVASGQLNPQEENDLRSELNRIGGLQGSYLADGTLTNAEVQTLLNEMTNFSARLSAYLTNTTAVATGNYRDNRWFRNYYGKGTSGDFYDNQQLLKSNIDSRQAQIDSAIMQGVNSGRLTWNDSQNYRSELNRIADSENAALADGRMSHSESQQIMDSLDALNTKLTNRLNGQGWGRGQRGKHGSSINYQQSLLKQRLDRGRASGRLTPQEYRQLSGDEQRIRDMENQMRLSGGRLTFDEQKRLLNQIDQLSRRINRAVDDRQTY